jgi:hypothetical protein
MPGWWTTSELLAQLFFLSCGNVLRPHLSDSRVHLIALERRHNRFEKNRQLWLVDVFGPGMSAFPEANRESGFQLVTTSIELDRRES